MSEYMKEKQVKFAQSEGMAKDMAAFHNIKCMNTVLDIYNWPPDGSIGYGVSFIYHLILDSGIKVKRVTRDGESYTVTFDVEYDTGWAPQQIKLTPRPEK